MSDFLRDLSAGTLGFIVGNTRGASNAVKLARLVTKEKMPPIPSRKRKSSNGTSTQSKRKRVAAATAASRRRIAIQKKRKRRPRSKKILKVGQGRKGSFAEKVNKVLQKDQSTMTYSKIYNGVLQDPVSDGQRLSMDLFQNGALVPGSAFRFFCPRKINDAASIGFNTKTAALDWTVGLGNFPNAGLRIRVSYASVKLTFRNNTQVGIQGELYEFKSKKTNNTAVNDRITSDLSSIVQTGGTTATSLRFGVKPTQLPTIQADYDTVTRKFFLKPGQHFVQKLILTDTIFDYDELTDGGVLNDLLKHVTVEVLLRYWMDLSTAKGTSADVSGRFGVPDIKSGFICEVQELYKIVAPHETEDVNNKPNWCWFNTVTAPVDNHQYINNPATFAGPPFV